ncbi:hypothetical protein MUCCIDRAFT_79967 [Mucor lusitanicus CBS 277.49]|uniref:Uncharacterized protein n=1 Tax=Mucor lusitanicus CBS 277.49 TaxID=747725 RepID=A0A168MFZ3_MUCCL|nr:hypothetical protein MUCCIDRAFT_79967 [Mucor lusitanicus CBS 277.49]
MPEESKADWRKNATEVVFRRTLLQMVDLEQSEERFNKLFDCLDIVLYCTETNVVVPLTFLEELSEAHTTSGCEKIFNYIEKRKSRITVDMVPGKGKGLILLRMCNDLLRRLSKETNTVFCGRILMFLANSFPLGERSGVNLRGDFNTDMIHFDSDEEVDADPNMTDEQKSFYKLFWSTRVFFSNPPTIFADDNFKTLQQGTDKIVEKFDVIGEKEAEILGARKNEGSKRSREDYENGMEEDPAIVEEMLALINRDYRFPRLLSSRRLLDLEMEDARFRRNVIVQYLILFQYLSGFSAEEKEKTKEALAARGATKQSLIQPSYTLSEDQVKWIEDTKQVLLKLLRAIKPHGKLYTDIILTILEHERHWIIWKASGCPAFEKQPRDNKLLEQSRLVKKPRLEAPPRKYRFSHGNFEVSKLFGNSTNTSLSNFMLNRPKIPSGIEIIDSSLMELDDSLDPPQDRFNFANGVLLQASRIVYEHYPSLIRLFYAAKKECYKEMHEQLNEAKEAGEEEDEPANKPSMPDFIVGEKITEDHVQAEISTLKKAREILTEEMANKDEEMKE